MRVRSKYEITIEVDSPDGIDPSAEVIEGIIKRAVGASFNFSELVVEHIVPTGLLGATNEDKNDLFISGTGVAYIKPEFVKTSNGLVLVGGCVEK